SPTEKPRRARSGASAGAASLLLAAAAQADRPEALAIALVREARTHFDAAVLVFVVEQRTRRAAVVAGDPLPTRGDWFGLDEASPLAEALETGTPVRLSTAQARELALASGLQPRPQAALVAPMPHPGGAVAHILLVAAEDPDRFDDEDLDAAPAARSAFADVTSAVAVPMRWDGELRGVLWSAFTQNRVVLDEDAQLLSSFAELAAVACRNASVHADLAEAARTDALTGCMN